MKRGLSRLLLGLMTAALHLDTPIVRAESRVPPAAANVGIEDRRGARLPAEARFRASDGRDVRLGDVLGNGRPALLVLAYNRCEMLCSLVLRSLADLVRDLGPSATTDIGIVTISIDPRDTVHEAARMQAVMLDRAGLSGQPARWSFLVGDREEIDSVASQIGFRYAWDPATEQYAHPAVIFAVAPEGRVASYFSGLGPDPAAVLAVLRGGGESGGGQGIASAILSCFRFETAKSRYGGLIEAGLRAGAGALVLSLGGLITWLSYRGRARARRMT